MSGMLTTADAATRLGVTETRVRALIAAGTLQAAQFAGRWVVDDASLESLAARQRPVGHRAMSPRVAWAAAAHLDGSFAHWVQGSQRSRLKRHLHDHLDADTWLARLAHRAIETRDVRVHQEHAKRLIDDPRIRRSGTNSLLLVGDGLVGGAEHLNVWLGEDDLADVTAEYGLRRSSRPNLRVRVAPAEVAQHWADRREVYRLIVAADLWDEGDARSRATAVELIESIGPLRD